MTYVTYRGLLDSFFFFFRFCMYMHVLLFKSCVDGKSTVGDLYNRPRQEEANFINRLSKTLDNKSSASFIYTCKYANLPETSFQCFQCALTDD